MFVNMETTVLRELINAEADSRWNALVARLLCSDQRELVVGKVASALQRSICEQEMPCDALAADLYAQALKRVDFYTIALDLVHAVEVAESCGLPAAILTGTET
jgi:hypothetical protein